MTTSSGEEGWCGPCGHLLNEHTAPRYSKCKKCKTPYTICQVGSHGIFSADGESQGRRICFVPCYCGVQYYPSSARGVRQLQSHEYHPDHPGYWPRDDYQEYSSTADYADASTANYMAVSCTPTATASPYTTETYTTSTFITSGPSRGHARQLSEESEDPLAAIGSTAGTAGASTQPTQARHMRFGSRGSDDPLSMGEPQQISDLADAFAQVDIGGPASQQHQQPAAEAEPILVGTHVKKDTVRFEHAGRKFKTRPDEWMQLSTAEGDVYLQFADPSSGQLYWTWAFGLTTLESQLEGYQDLGDQTWGGQGSGGKGDKKGKGKATKGGAGSSRKK